MVLCYHENNFDLSGLLNSHFENWKQSARLLASLWLGLAMWAVDGPRCCGPHVGHVDGAAWARAARRPCERRSSGHILSLKGQQ